MQKGAAEAGAVFLVNRRSSFDCDLFSPALQMSYGEDQASERLFEERLTHATESEVDVQLQKERQFDSDIWIVEIEGCDIKDFVELQKTND